MGMGRRAAPQIFTRRASIVSTSKQPFYLNLSEKFTPRLLIKSLFTLYYDHLIFNKKISASRQMIRIFKTDFMKLKRL